jgi:hypothetical protein
MSLPQKDRQAGFRAECEKCRLRLCRRAMTIRIACAPSNRRLKKKTVKIRLTRRSRHQVGQAPTGVVSPTRTSSLSVVEYGQPRWSSHSAAGLPAA